ncbi:VWA domain-containing protein [Sphingomonas oligophenolica]|uniref:VWA domain-containing protein n=1 Tax=Sphingomonas oligophenolica TaxID=301154 RepID=A0ABU9Y7T0_9SPHN
MKATSIRTKALACVATGALLLAGCDKARHNANNNAESTSLAESSSDMASPVADPSGEKYKPNDISPVHAVADAPVSTFAVDVDTGAYANVRRFLNAGQLPPKDAVRTEEMINYFRYDYPLPADRAAPFSVTTDVAQTPWNHDTKLLRIGLRGYDLSYAKRPPANLVFLVDVSGSMDEPDKLPLVKAALSLVADNLQPRDKVGIVVYAGAAGVVLEPTSDATQIKAALDQLSAGGSTAGGEGIKLAYDTARASFIKGGINRILIATDGDFNVGVTDQRQLEQLIEKERDDGITLTTLGFGQGNFNDALMESMADLGNGNYAYIDSAMEARKVLSEELSSTLFTIAKDVKVQVEFNPAYVSQYRLIGYENRALAEQDFANDKVDAGDIGAGHQVTAIYEVVPAGSKGWLPDRHFTANTRRALAGDRQNGEMAYVRLRYKLPEGDTSRLIERPIAATLLNTQAPPQGDMAFATAVAAFGQKLRGDTRLGDIGYADIRRLAGSQSGYWRQEFVKLTELAEAGQAHAAPQGGGID